MLIENLTINLNINLYFISEHSSRYKIDLFDLLKTACFFHKQIN